MLSDIPFSGSFLWSKNSINESILIAPSMSISTTSCLSFKYYISEDGMLKLYSNLTSIWSISNAAKSRWRSGQVQLTNKDDSFRLSFGSSSDVGLDDLKIITGECSALGMFIGHYSL